MKKNSSVLNKIASKKVRERNEEAIQAFNSYKQAMDILESVELASGKKINYESNITSTLKFEINQHGVKSTTAQIF